MKNFLGILVLGLLLSSKAYAETVELEQGIKLNIPKGYTYVELNYKDYQDENAQGFLSNKELKEYYENMGITGTEKVLIIGKDVVYGMVNFYKHDLDGKKPEEWKGLVEIAKKCESKNSEKAFMKCFVKTMADPYIEVFVSGTSGPLIDGLSNVVQEIKNDPDLQKEAKKFSEKIEKNFSGLGKVKGKVKMVHLDKKKWGVVVVSKTRTMGIKLTKEMYLFPHNNHVFSIASACISKKNCKDIAKKVIEVLQPYLSEPEDKNEIKKAETKKKT